MQLDSSNGTWAMLDGTPAEHAQSDERRRIVEAVRAETGIGPKRIAEASGVSHDVVKQLVRRMVDTGTLDSDGQGHYFLPIHSVHSVHPEGDAVNAVNEVNGIHSA